MLSYRRIVTGNFDTNTYLLWSDKGDTWIIDPGDYIPEQLDNLDKAPSRILLTHAHYDHIRGIPKIKEEYDTPLCAHHNAERLLTSANANLSSKMGEPLSLELDIPIDESEKLILGDDEIDVIHTPGHSEGSITLITDELIICGDLIFSNGGVGRVDLPGGSLRKLRKSIQKILENFDDRLVLPGHGPEFRLSNKSEEDYLENL